MSEDEIREVVEAGRLLMLEAMTMDHEFGPKVTVAALLSCASAIAVESGVSPRAFAEMALGAVEMAYPDACDAAEGSAKPEAWSEWRP